MVVAKSSLTLEEEYVERFAGSQRLYEDALRLLPSGVTHDNRYLTPFPIYVTRAKGSHKFDVDGHELIDYWVGHGALLLGHGRPEVVAAVVEQAQRGTHYGACHELEVEWAKLIVDLVPCAEEVKFLSSGTEATLMAFRLARAFTGRKKILKFTAQFHGWHDYATVGVAPPYETPTSLGIPEEVAATMAVVPWNDTDAVRRVLETGEVAAVILEPSGGFHGIVPPKPGLHAELRELTRATDTLLIFDEVITGFRWAPGGAQEFYGVTPDLSTHAKIVAGGLPGGVVAGRADILDALSMPRDPGQRRFKRVAHPGTFNANPLSAAAGVAALRLVKTGEPTRRAAELAERLRRGLSEVFARLGIPGLVYGEASVFQTVFGPNAPSADEVAAGLWQLDPARLQRGVGDLTADFRRGMLLGGVDLPGATGMLSSAHDEKDVDETVQVFAATLKRLVEEKKLSHVRCDERHG